MNFRRLVSLLTSPLLVIAACPFVCGGAWVIRISVCVCCVPRSVFLSASVSAVSVPMPGLLAAPSVFVVCAYAWVVCLYFLIFLL